ncbi:MAG: hypothetical protein ACREMG_14195 [Gemmatimonadales bacterium]
MNYPFTAPCGRTRLRLSVLAFLAVFVATACDEADPVASSAPSDVPAVAPTEDPVAAVESPTPSLATITYAGLPYGPTSLWASPNDVKWGPAPFTGSQAAVEAGGIVTQINTARQLKHRIMLAMTGGPSTDYTTSGKFDMAKWKKQMNTFNTSTIKNAVAAGLADGTIIGNTMIDEPETVRWGGNISKSVIDDMAAYARSIFPTLPVGINIGPPAYRWRATERFRKLDFVRYQYNWWITEGNVAAWRDAVLAQAKLDGVTPAFSLNILDGGIKDKNGSWDCPGTGGKGTYAPNCRMTADQVSSWGRALATAGCYLMMWRYDGTFMSKSANQEAFRDVASAVASRSPRSCKRP